MKLIWNFNIICPECKEHLPEEEHEPCGLDFCYVDNGVIIKIVCRGCGNEEVIYDTSHRKTTAGNSEIPLCILKVPLCSLEGYEIDDCKSFVSLQCPRGCSNMVDPEESAGKGRSPLEDKSRSEEKGSKPIPDSHTGDPAVSLPAPRHTQPKLIKPNTRWPEND